MHSRYALDMKNLCYEDGNYAGELRTQGLWHGLTY